MNIDLNGLSRSKALAKIGAAVDHFIAEAIERTDLMLRDHGGTDREVESYLTDLRAECAESRDSYVGQIARWLDEPRAPAALQ